MITLISPAKTLDENPAHAHKHTLPIFLKESKTLVNLLKKYKVKDLMELMDISEKLAKQNYNRYRNFDSNFSLENSSPAILTFKGDVYLGLKAEEFDQDDLNFAQDNLRILSGLYGVLKPLDLMQPYRLEMGSRLTNRRGKDLYTFWGDRITKAINEDLEKNDAKVIINAASNEYFKAINKKKLKASIIDVNFFEERKGKRVFVSFSAKKARGLVSAFIIKNRITDPQQLKGFDEEDYIFDEETSNEHSYTFVNY